MSAHRVTEHQAETVQSSIERIRELLLMDRPAVDVLAEVHYLTVQADELSRSMTTDARAEGASWAAIGDALGTTRQAAQQRFSR